MQSSNFVEGVSGWRIADGRIELYGGLAPIILEKTPEPGKPSVVVDGVTCLSEAFIKDGSITKTAVGGKPHLAGFGVGVELPFIAADRFAINGRDASEILDMIAGKIRETELGVGLKGAIADQVREVIRAECKPGGILYRLR
ncbi:hypothetical protein A9978_32200 [Pseudomonas sp. UMC65]|uniref:hypothetical protein n=1 Tax=Pseudomonas sp. UMC65 TaxID=1862323 RepID=UPI0016048949|nr:hypothetical protein [Pseudomonas sp. UMC65]MBB1617122.1 hypothetical protein [Pseudomonas sp. UMC65]